jgi:hypothetical protein
MHFWREGDHSGWQVDKVKADKGTAQEDEIKVVDELEANK